MYENIAKDMVKELVNEDEASIIATPAAAFLTSEDGASDPEEMSAGEEASFISTLDIPPPPLFSINLEDSENLEDLLSPFDIPPPPPTMFNEFSINLEDSENLEDLLDIELEELPEQIYEDEEIDDPTSVINNTEDQFLCFKKHIQSTYSTSEVVIEDSPTYDDDEVFGEIQNLAVFPIDPSGRPRIHYDSEDRIDDHLEFRRNLLEDIPIEN